MSILLLAPLELTSYSLEVLGLDQISNPEPQQFEASLPLVLSPVVTFEVSISHTNSASCSNIEVKFQVKSQFQLQVIPYIPVLKGTTPDLHPSSRW